MLELTCVLQLRFVLCPTCTVRARSARTCRTRPPQVPRKVDVEFYARTSTPDHFLRLPVTLRTTGNNCQHVVAKSLTELFRASGLPDSFRWGDGYWERKIFVQTEKEGEEEEA